MGKLEKALNDYEERFKKPYPLVIVSEKSDIEIIKEIENCIKNGEEAEQPTYGDDIDY